MLSIITPNLNNAKYLEDNIKSIMSLGIPFEHIIVDGGSTDGSLDIISKYPHVKLLHQIEKTGMYGAIHQGFTQSSGELMTWINADDRIISSGYEAMYSKAIEKEYDIVYSDGNYFYIKDNQIKFARGRRFGKFFLKHGCIPTMQPSIIFSKKIYDTVGGLRYNNFKICGDLDLFVRIANKKESKFYYLPTLSAIFMKRGDSLGDLNNDLYLQELKNNNLPIPGIFIRILFFISKYI
jgi:glycosyltransferase involved in cell wall biosynthesis